VKKRKHNNKFRMPVVPGSLLLLIFLFPIILLIMAIVLFIWFCLEYPTYRKSHSKRDDNIDYSHAFYKSDSFQLNELLHEKNMPIKIVYENRDDIYFVGKYNYFFLINRSWFFKIDNGTLFISDDGDSYKNAEFFLKKHGPNNDRTSLIMLFNDQAINLSYEPLDLMGFPEVIVANSIEDFVTSLSQKESQP